MAHPKVFEILGSLLNFFDLNLPLLEQQLLTRFSAERRGLRESLCVYNCVRESVYVCVRVHVTVRDKKRERERAADLMDIFSNGVSTDLYDRLATDT